MIAPDILYVEDNEDFTFIMQHAVKAIDENVKLLIVPNGNEALAIFNRYQDFEAPPKLILLDMNLPGFSGVDLLKMIKGMAYFDLIPVVFFSTSDDPKDKDIAKEFGAADFITKPGGYLELLTCVRSIFDQWILTPHY